MFIDNIKIYVKAGDGGNGAVSFHREKYVAAGGPDGGDGGRGGSIIFRVDTGANTLLAFRYKRKFVAESGEGGKGGKMHGKNGADVYVSVPPGTLIKDPETGKVIYDMARSDEYVLCRGGRGGWGNRHFATPTRQIPRFAKSGTKGEEREVLLELKMLAEVGLIGFPNVGKSSILSEISSAKPKIANYHFTTLSPNLGVSEYYDNRFVVADIPGLIDGASEGLGLGHDFLRHVDRTRLVVHVVDISGSEGRDPVQDYYNINNELKQYNEELASVPQIVALSKSDMADIEQIERFKKETGTDPVVMCSIIHEGIDELKKRIWTTLLTLPPVEPMQFEPFEYEKKDTSSFYITRDDDGAFELEGGMMEELARNVVLDSSDSFAYFQKRLKDAGVIKALKKAGIEDGDTVRVMDIEFEFVE